jgi:hypothetical protein
MFSTYAYPAKIFLTSSLLICLQLNRDHFSCNIKLRGTLKFLFFKGILDNYKFSLSSVFATLVLCYVGLMPVSAKQLNILAGLKLNFFELESVCVAQYLSRMIQKHL